MWTYRCKIITLPQTSFAGANNISLPILGANPPKNLPVDFAAHLESKFSMTPTVSFLSCIKCCTCSPNNNKVEAMN